MHCFYCFNVLYVLQITSVSLVLVQQHNNINHQVGKTMTNLFCLLLWFHFVQPSRFSSQRLSPIMCSHTLPYSWRSFQVFSFFQSAFLSFLKEKKSLQTPLQNSWCEKWRQSKFKIPCYLLDSIKCQSVFPTQWCWATAWPKLQHTHYIPLVESSALCHSVFTSMNPNKPDLKI